MQLSLHGGAPERQPPATVLAIRIEDVVTIGIHDPCILHCLAEVVAAIAYPLERWSERPLLLDLLDRPLVITPISCLVWVFVSSYSGLRDRAMHYHIIIK